MAATNVVEIVDDDDDEVCVLYSTTPPPVIGTTKLNAIPVDNYRRRRPISMITIDLTQESPFTKTPRRRFYKGECFYSKESPNKPEESPFTKTRRRFYKGECSNSKESPNKPEIRFYKGECSYSKESPNKPDIRFYKGECSNSKESPKIRFYKGECSYSKESPNKPDIRFYKGECSNSKESPKIRFYKGECSYSKESPNKPEICVQEKESLKKPEICVEVKESPEKPFTCEICVEDKSISDAFRVLGCDHSYCTECIAKYVVSKLDDNITTINCPVPNCEGYFEPQHCRFILPKEVFDRWGDALCEALILGSEKFYCPYKDCSALLIHDSNEVIAQSECPSCYRLFCGSCKVPWHAGISCGDFQKLNKDERGKEDIMLMNLANNQKWKRCPKCKVYVSKDTGCLFMRCRCGHHFCYDCGFSLTVTAHFNMRGNDLPREREQTCVCLTSQGWTGHEMLHMLPVTHHRFQVQNPQHPNNLWWMMGLPK